MMSDAEYRNRFYRVAKQICKTYDTLGPNELARRCHTNPRAAYMCQLAFRGITLALREEGYLPRDMATTIRGSNDGPYVDDGIGEIVTLSEAQKLVQPGPQLMVGRITKRRGV